MNGKILRKIDSWLGIVLVAIAWLSASLVDLFVRRDVVRSIAVIRFWAIGETVLVLPMVKALRKKYPGCKITGVTTQRVKDVLEASELFDEIITIGAAVKRFKGFDLVIDTEPFTNASSIVAGIIGKRRIGFRRFPRSMMYTESKVLDDSIHEKDAFLKLIGEKPAMLVRLKTTKTDKAKAVRLLADSGISKKMKIICVAPSVGESAKHRMWPVKRMKTICTWLEQKGYKVIIVGGKHDKECADSDVGVNLAGKLNIRELAALCEISSVFLSNDTGPMHLAAAQGCRTIGLFGPNIPDRFAPAGKGCMSLYKGTVCEYSPCINVHKGSIPECRYSRSAEYQKCMKAISENDVKRALQKVLT